MGLSMGCLATFRRTVNVAGGGAASSVAAASPVVAGFTAASRVLVFCPNLGILHQFGACTVLVLFMSLISNGLRSCLILVRSFPPATVCAVNKPAKEQVL